MDSIYRTKDYFDLFTLVFFLAWVFAGFGGTLWPFSFASEIPIATACCGFVTLSPLLDFNVPFFILRIAFRTVRWAFFEYLAMVYVFVLKANSMPPVFKIVHFDPLKKMGKKYF
jgi:hypothetical protein